ncbi:MAG: 50S ribosomal protein L15 [Candidatus Muiribacterium halophilum]|uniref:Large ribosomal subunit protein uL15 n=1 Tax=Muiribacterium halophilum TaxID=2053465 RepID=A0A2N5ZJF5_MUIH1|nr:MAG: 50S ribosomal protein L15 [Candidatus Muirbacterium halophilum]
MITLNNFKKKPGARKAKKRVARGVGSGSGKTAGRGENGQQSRSGYSRRYGFEGGQMPLIRKIPKRGFSNYHHRKHFTILNISKLNVFEDGTDITPELLLEKGVISKIEKNGVKILGNGNLEKKLNVFAHKFTETAMKKIQDASGKAEVIK